MLFLNDIRNQKVCFAVIIIAFILLMLLNTVGSSITVLRSQAALLELSISVVLSKGLEQLMTSDKVCLLLSGLLRLANRGH